MAWVRLDDGFIDHPKIARLSDRALRWHLHALCHCSRFLTDGYVSAAHVRGIPKKILAELTHELWEPYDDGYLIHDYLDYNMSRSQWKELKAKRSKAGSKGGNKAQAGRLAEAKAIYLAHAQASGEANA